MGRHGRLYSKMKVRPRNYRYAMFEKGPVPKIVDISDYRKAIVSAARAKNKRRKKKGKAPKFFVWDYKENETIYPRG